MKRIYIALLSVILVLGISLPAGAENWRAVLPPDTILVNGNIITVDPDDSIAQALAIKDARIIAVGSNGMIKSLKGNNTQVINLRGRTVTPGLIDSHIHFSGTSMLYRMDLSYPGVQSIVDVVEKVQAQVEILEPGEWVQGRGWDEGKFTELRYIYASDLDPVTPDNPTWLTHTMGHYGTANSLALEVAGITAATPDPPGGTIDRYPDGTPTGVLKENAMRLVSRLVPDFTMEQQEKGIIALCEEYNKEGMTSAKGAGGSLSKWTAFQNVLREGKLTVRIFMLWRGGETIESAESTIDQVAPFTKPYITTGDDLLISGGIKMAIDGSGGARTAWMWDEWNKNFTEVDEGNYGYPGMDPDIFHEMVKMYHNAGLNVNVHAIGDRGIDWAVEAFKVAIEENPINGLRHGIIHCNIPTDWAIDTMAEMQAEYDAGYPLAQSVFMWWIGDTYAGNFGPDRSLRLMPFNTYLEHEMIWGGGSDYGVDPFPARYGIWASIARTTLLGVYGWNPYGMEESIDVHDALRSYSIWNARQMFMEEKTGSLEVGKYADIAIWDKDMYTIPTDEIKDLKCLMTFVGGKIVYQDPTAW